MQPGAHLSVPLEEKNCVQRKLTFIVCPPGPEFFQSQVCGVCPGDCLFYKGSVLGKGWMREVRSPLDSRGILKKSQDWAC